jgi:hypothetical protein
MKHSIPFCASLMMACNLLATAAHAQGVPDGGYSLKTAETRPIPRDEHLRLWREVALKQCGDARNRFNLSPERCLPIIAARADTCSAKLAPETPALAKTTLAVKDVGRKYLQCATPYYFCKGIEVKTEAEVLARCR